ncbi:MAG: aldo/keto reductase [Gammaproteobacteria bacterium]|nr:aldo/keto reductase [Gammaproteobacteria bacterium]
MTTRWGILATGRIAHTLASAINVSATAELVAVGSRTQEKADKFAAEYDDIKAHGTYEDLLADPNVDAVYVSTPHPQHVEWTIKVLDAGKAVLCEKPMGLNHAEVMSMVHAARENHCFLLEAFMYRMHPQTQQIRDLLTEEAIGELRHIHATFAFNAPFSETSRLYAAELGGGGIMDVGCYPVSMARMIAGSEPTDLAATGMLARTGVDLYTSALLSFEGGVGAHIATGVGQQLENSVAIFGTRGSIHVAWPWQCPADWRVTMSRGGETEEFTGTSESAYVYQIDEVDRCLQSGLVESPAMTWEDSIGNALVLDKWRAALEIKYPQETAETLAQPVYGRPLNTANTTMPRDTIAGVGKSLSRVVMGCDNQPNLPHAAVMFDHFIEQGGNVFDTAYIYGGGQIETLLGQWLKARSIRKEVAIIGKGAHTPLNRPEYCRPQLTETLERLQTDHLDIYFLHRDNTDVDVGEWVGALNELYAEGLIHVFGGSNWEIARIEAANRYAAENGKQRFSVVSNQFSLAKMLSPVWPGCISANTDDFRAFLSEQDIALFPWSSQARGFFTPRYDSIRAGESSAFRDSWNQPGDAEMKRCWFSEENFDRRDRAMDIADQKGVELINVALAYVLAQPFRTFPLIGPRFLWETSSSLQALEVELSDTDIAWLDLAEKR